MKLSTKSDKLKHIKEKSVLSDHYYDYYYNDFIRFGKTFFEKPNKLVSEHFFVNENLEGELIRYEDNR